MTFKRDWSDRRWAALGGMVIVLLGLAGCTTNPATGEDAFTLFMSPEDERRVGAQEHPQVLARFGGVYQEEDVGGYVAVIGGRLVANSEMPDFPFTFTVLNSPEVNAFALPGGYVYVTRGILGLANSEAELAGVLAHEIGHVVARHPAQRYSRAVAANLGSALLGAVVGGTAGQLAQLGSELYLAGFSREQEFEADALGVRYLRAAGYEPAGVAAFLENLTRYTALQEDIVDREMPDAGFFATHPNTPDRVARALNLAGGEDGVVRHREYLSAIDGIVYGDDPSQGLIRGNRFSHPELRLTFEAPGEFRLINTAEAVYARKRGEAVVIFDAAAREETHPDPLVYITQIWGSDLDLEGAERIEVNGLPGATASARVSGSFDDYRGPLDARLVAVQFPGNRIYRFLFLSVPSRTASLRTAFQRMTYSLRPLSDAEAAQIVPLTVETLEVDSGDTVASLAARLPFEDLRVERFRTLNGLDADEGVAPGDLVKVIAE